MIYNLSRVDHQEAFKQRANALFQKKCRVQLVEKRKKRTYKQNRYLHLIFYPFADYSGYTIEQVKQDIFKRIVNRELFIESTEFGERTRSTTELDTREMTIAIERYKHFCLEKHGIYIPDPHEDEILASIEEEYSRYEAQVFT